MKSAVASARKLVGMNQSLAPAQWRAARCSHVARLAPFVEAHRARRSRGNKHAVWDFLWEYYNHKPAQLLQWSPGFGLELQEGAAEFNGKFWSPTARDAAQNVALDIGKFPRHRAEGAREILHLLEQTAARAPFHGCFGLHEWAMVYRGAVRHPSPLRLRDDEIAQLVETQEVRCSHYDAFRFFTSAARPLNVLQPRSDNRAAFEQPGCIHANMDLYKWAYKFAPWVASEIVADAFELARDARWLDMRAAPYDLTEFGVSPICIETPAGRREYVGAQRDVAARAAPIRARLIRAYRILVEALE